jgi:hypothetical protein
MVAKRQKIQGGYTLPTEAFRHSMLDGTLELVPKAGVNNIPPQSQPPLVLPELAVAPKVDYLSFMWMATNLSDELRMVQEYSRCIFDREDFKPFVTEYSQTFRGKGSRGSSIEYRMVPGEGYHIRFSMGGNACGGISLEEMGRLLSRLYKCPGSHCSRLDINADSYHGHLPLDTIAKCLRDGDYSGYKCGEVIESVGNKKAGLTVYFGGRKSLQRVRFYDKAAESESDIPCVRHEVQYRGDRAEEVGRQIAGQSLEVLWDILLGRISGSVTMGHRRGGRADRIVVASFYSEWKAFLSRTTIAKVPIARCQSLPRTISWMKKSVSKSLAKLSQALPLETVYEFCLYLIKKGTDKIRDYELENIRQWIDEGGVCELRAQMTEEFAL